MKDVYEVLRQKEFQLMRVSREIEALRAILPLVQDVYAEGSEPSGNSRTFFPQNKWPLRVDNPRAAS